MSTTQNAGLKDPDHDSFTDTVPDDHKSKRYMYDCDHTDTHAIWSLYMCCSDIRMLSGCLIIIYLLLLSSGQTETFKMLQKFFLRWLLCCDVAVIVWFILSLPKSRNQA